MKKNIYDTLSIIFFSIAAVFFIYLFLVNTAALAYVFPYLFLSFIAGIVFKGLSINKTFSQIKAAHKVNHKYNQSRNRTYRTNSNNNKNSRQQFMDDMTRQQHQQFMNEMNMQQNEQFMNEMNMQQQQQQQQQFIDWSMEESIKSVTPFEHGGYDMDQGNSFNNDNNFGNGF